MGRSCRRTLFRDCARRASLCKEELKRCKEELVNDNTQKTRDSSLKWKRNEQRKSNYSPQKGRTAASGMTSRCHGTGARSTQCTWAFADTSTTFSQRDVTTNTSAIRQATYGFPPAPLSRTVSQILTYLRKLKRAK